jgi:hypothetical protein
MVQIRVITAGQPLLSALCLLFLLVQTVFFVFGTITPCFPHSVKIIVLAKNCGKLKDVNV